MAQYSIKDLERLSGIKAHTIRMWEKRYGLIDPARTDTNIRNYSDEDLKKLLNVSILNRYGIKISHIAAMKQAEIAEKILMVTRDSSDYDSLIENLVITMVDMDEEGFEKIATRAIMQIGFEDTVLKIIYPFFEKIGVLWQTGAINPAQEHFISNLIRQKIIMAIDSVIPEHQSDPRRFLLYLPEGELHELGLLFYQYILLKRGHQVTYLGQWVPLADMASATTVLKTDYLLTSIMSVYSGQELPDYLHKLSRTFPQQKILVTGYQTANFQGELPRNVILLSKVGDLFTVID
jgi:DNA-binding transcriptional MerR regulator